MICLLCPSLAVADCLCVACGAKVWAAQWWKVNPGKARDLVDQARHHKAHRMPLIGFTEAAMQLFEARFAALLDVTTYQVGEVLLTRLQAAKEARGVS